MGTHSLVGQHTLISIRSIEHAKCYNSTPSPLHSSSSFPPGIEHEHIVNQSSEAKHLIQFCGQGQRTYATEGKVILEIAQLYQEKKQ